MTDSLVKLYFKNEGARACALRLDDSWRAAVGRQDLPAPVRALLGELTAAAVLLAAGLKFDGALIVQIQGDGPVKLAVAEVRAGLAYRATAQMREGAAPAPGAGLQELVNASGRGRCAVILDPAGRAEGEQPWQGVVALEGATVAAVIERYMAQSEQIPTRLWLAAGEAAAGGVLLQRVAAGGGAAAHTP
ncbi:MAG: Hsp33 family molecular chaperone HslO, partial [Duodenibacillus sp.]|nr:Hsp33 family molecular chaperone HslO [Duodenibacillus sp.]